MTATLSPTRFRLICIAKCLIYYKFATENIMILQSNFEETGLPRDKEYSILKFHKLAQFDE